MVEKDDDWINDRLWGAKAIADFVPCCQDTIYAWAKLPGTPIRKINGRLVTRKSALTAWLMGQNPAAA